MRARCRGSFSLSRPRSWRANMMAEAAMSAGVAIRKLHDELRRHIIEVLSLGPKPLFECGSRGIKTLQEFSHVERHRTGIRDLGSLEEQQSVGC